MAFIMRLITLLFFVTVSTAAPGVYFPISSQIPPIARIGEPFSFVFSKSTFTSSSAVTYSLTNSPKWLSIDSDARRLYGTPKEADVGPGEMVDIPFGLVATDETGSTTLDITLIASRKPGPKLDIPLNQQIPGFGFFSNPYTILSPPRNQFSFTLDPKTFSTSSDKPLTYYAVMSDNTPLPAWISFDAGRLAFSGQTPASEALIDPPQTFEFQLLATETPGFAGASMRFNIVVGNHRVTADQTTVVINATAGKSFSYDGLRDRIKVDGLSMSPDDGLTIADTFDVPSWLTLEKDSLRIAGTPPMTAKSTDFTIALEDSFADSFNLTVMVQVSGTRAQDSSLLKDELPVIKAQAGERISFDLSPYLEDPDGTEIAIDDDGSPSWVDVRERTIVGDVPDSSKDSVVSVSIKLTSKALGTSESVLLSVHMVAESGDAADTTDAASKPDSTSTGAADDSKPRKHTPTPIGLILLCTILPGLLLIGALMSMLICCLRRRREAKRSKLSTRDISGPLPGTFTINVTSPDGQSSMEHITGPHNTQSTIGRMSLASQDRKSDIESGISRHQSFDSDVPRPLSTIRMLPTNEELLPASSSLLDVTGSPLMSGAVGGNPRNRRHERTQTLLSHISETSYYEEHSAGITIDNTLEFLGNSNTRGSFRDGVEVDIPCLNDVSSIQPTPNSAYTGESYWSKLGSGPSVHNRSPAIGSLHDDPSRTSRIQPAMLARKLIWPWFKGRVVSIKGVAEKFGRAARTAQNDMPPLSSVQASLHEKTPDTSLVSSNKQSDSSGIPDFPSPPQATRRPPITKYERPVTRRAVGTGRIVIPKQRLVSSKVEVVGSPTEEKKQPSPTSSFNRPSRNSLGISYADMVSNSPFHESSTWSTIPSSHEWHDETIQSLENADSVVLPNSSLHRRSRSASQPNWAPYKDSLSNINTDGASSKYPQSQWSFAPIPRPQPQQPLGDASSIASQGLTKRSASGGHIRAAPSLGSVGGFSKAPSSFWLDGNGNGNGKEVDNAEKENKWDIKELI
ncbi:hypothetical protein B0T20DRAFT_449779 [Sordaria brevicollis]|uniref:Dystroglycan-type cadherin-like domain-containing protein n=1 Tax=Sordaria brevicollis TaxID=83679 RepID=A0AAE0UGR8_SORBR|nr:hypothetical protein B0T20DRAFT_449779 [Sordaria brevicollis]